MKRPPEWPWSALLDQLARPLDGADPGPGVERAWEEVAGRLGLIRLGWFERRSRGELRIALASPCVRAVARWRVLVGTDIPEGPVEGLHVSPHEHIACVARPGGFLVAGAPPSGLPARPALGEIAALAEALAGRRRERRIYGAALDRARTARRIGAAAHDLRNELTRAMLLVERNGANDRDEVVRALRSARDIAHGTLAGDGHGRIPELTEIPLRPLLAEACAAAGASARGAAAGRGAPPVRLRCPRTLHAFAEGPSLDRALRNVILNAIEAAARRGDGAEVRVQARRDASFDGPYPEAGFDLRIDVEDTGVGMGEEQLARFLEPRGVPARSTEAARTAVADELESTGLGTASLQLALEANGIPLRVTSQPGRGTTVTLRLRSARPSEVILDPDVRRGRRRARATLGAVHVVNAEAAQRLQIQ